MFWVLSSTAFIVISLNIFRRFVSDKMSQGAGRKCEERKEGGRTDSIAEQVGGAEKERIIRDKVARVLEEEMGNKV